MIETSKTTRSLVAHILRISLGACLLSACATTSNVGPAESPATEVEAASELPGPVKTSPTVASELLPEDLAAVGSSLDPKKTPAQNFQLRPWKLTLPVADPDRGEGKVLEIKESKLTGGEPGAPGYVDVNWFFSDAEAGALVFKTPNHAATTKNSSNTRSELREMVRAGNTSTGTKDPGNNWVLSSHPKADTFGAIGGTLAATLQVDWVSTSGNDAKFGAHAVVVGQIHGSGKMEPLKIFYRKLPNHDKGSLFWNYEIRPANQDDRQDISHNVWGDSKLTKNDASPADGIALGERISYVVEVVGTNMVLSFKKADGTVVVHERDLGTPYPGFELDLGYNDDWMYFKVGAYNQCNLGTEGVWGTGCTNNGLDAGDYTQVRFYDIRVAHSGK